ncbi:MAG: ParB/RepB/Spo0J family partition protein [bacterium]
MKKLEMLPLGQIIPNSYNPNDMSEESFEELKKEIEHRGSPSKPIVVRKTDEQHYTIVDGEHEFTAVKELGYTEVLCEIVDIDETESMRQTYKRNLGGENNKVKLGKMFQDVLKKNGWTQRELAKEFNIGKDFVGNSILYAEAAENAVSDSATISKLSIRQLHAYMAFPPEIRDKWITAGADIDILSGNARKIKGLQRVFDAGLTDLIDGSTSQGFMDSIGPAILFVDEEAALCVGKDEAFRGKLREYMKSCAEHSRRFASIFGLIYDQKKNQFFITSQEFAGVIEHCQRDAKARGSLYYCYEENVKPALIEVLQGKGIVINPNDLSSSWDQMKREIKEKAIDCIKNSSLSVRCKWALYKIQSSEKGPHVHEAIIETIKEMKEIYKSEDSSPTVLSVEHRFDRHIQIIEEREAIRQIPEEQLVDRIIGNMELYADDTENYKRLAEILNKLTLSEKQLLERITSKFKGWDEIMKSAISGLQKAGLYKGR